MRSAPDARRARRRRLSRRSPARHAPSARGRHRARAPRRRRARRWRSARRQRLPSGRAISARRRSRRRRELGVAGDRGVAGAVERRQQRPLGAHAGAARRIVDRREQRPRRARRPRGIRGRSRPGRPPAACLGREDHGARRRRAPGASARPARAASRRPRRPRACAVGCSTLPRRLTTRRSGRRASSCAWRRSEALPITRALRQAVEARAAPARSARRADPRAASTAPITRPSGSQVGRSFIECTARSMLPLEQRGLDLLAEQALAAELGERPVGHPIAGRADHHDLERAGRGELRHAAAAQRAADQRGLRRGRAASRGCRCAGGPSWSAIWL